MKKRLLIIAVCFCLTLSLAGHASAFVGSSSMEFPSRAFELYQKQAGELRAYASIDIGLEILGGLPDRTVAEHAQTMWDSFGADLWAGGRQDGIGYLLIVYSEADNQAALAGDEAVMALLSDEDIAAVEQAFAAPDGSTYQHICNGLKQLMIRVFDRGDFEIPPYSYAAEYLRDPDSVPVETLLPDTRVVVIDPEGAVSREAECAYLANEIGRFAGITASLALTAAPEGMTMAEYAEAYRTERFVENPDKTILLAVDPETGETAVAIGDGVQALLPDDAAETLAAAMAVDGDHYAAGIAGLEELARLLYADGAHEYGEFSGIALALDPTAFDEPAMPVWGWCLIGAGVVLLAGGAVRLLRKKK